MEKNSVRSGGKLHIPATYDDWPHHFIDPPVPLCSMYALGVDPSWSVLPPNCEACEVVKGHQDKMRAIMGKKPQLAMDLI